MAQTSIPDIGGLQTGLPGSPVDLEHNVTSTRVNMDTVGIPPGVMCARGTNDGDAILPATSSALMMGIVGATHDVPIDFLQFTQGMGSDGFQPGVVLNVITRGKAYVVVEQDVTEGDRAYVRYSANGAGKLQLGAFRKDSDGAGTSAHAVEVTSQVKFLATVKSGGVCPVSVDMLNPT
jgi:hypothetical protein